MAAYERLAANAELPLDAVIVSIGEESPAAAPMAMIRRPAAILNGRFMAAAEEGPYSVPEALKVAEEIRGWLGFERVVVVIDDSGKWNEDWGELRSDA